MTIYDKDKPCIQAIFQNFKNNVIYKLYNILYLWYFS